MNPEAQIEEYKKKVEPILESFFDRKIKEYEEISPFVKKFIEDLKEFTLRGGKRFRVALIYQGYKLLGGKDEDEILNISIFIELIQSFLLIHDDIADRSDLRRGGPTVHKIYENFSEKMNFQDDLHFGNSMGVLAGDLCNQFATEIITESSFPLENKNKLLSVVSMEISKVIFGQLHDILLSYDFPKEYKKEDILKVHKYKTATYTFRLPLFAGAILANANELNLAALDLYSIYCGIAFQIRDDIIGVFGEMEKTGKEVNGDISEGKKTLLVLEAYKNANAEQKTELDMYIGKKDLTELEASKVRKIFIDTGSLEYSKKECEEHVEMAKKALKGLVDVDQEAHQFLEGVADYMVVRDI